MSSPGDVGCEAFKTTGWFPADPCESDAMATRDLEAAARKSAVAGELLRETGPVGRTLVIGCGDGREAGHLARQLNVEVIGIDVGAEFEFAHEDARPAVLQLMDAQHLDFEDESFDSIYSFHALEHIPDPQRALSEMSRVLRRHGSFLIGTPNKSRLVGYIGSSAPVPDRISWNLQDWRARATGRWSNEEGAHAGFTSGELMQLCIAAFGDGRDVSNDYYRQLYAQQLWVVNSLIRCAVTRWAYPAVYVAGRVSV